MNFVVIESMCNVGIIDIGIVGCDLNSLIGNVTESVFLTVVFLKDMSSVN